MNQKLRELLYRSFDGGLSLEEEQLLEKGLAESEELRAEKARVVRMRKTIAESSAPGFSLGFADRVMSHIDAAEETVEDSTPFLESMLSLFRPVVAMSAAAVIMLVAVNLSTADSVSVASAFGLSENAEAGAWDTPLELMLGD